MSRSQPPRFRSALEQQSIELYHAGIHVIEKQQSIELYHHAGIHVIETAAKVVFAAVLGSIPVPVPGTWCVLYEYQIRGVLLSPTWYIRLHWYQVPGCIRVRSMLDMILLSEIAPLTTNQEA